jgi:hypothetical protein
METVRHREDWVEGERMGLGIFLATTGHGVASARRRPDGTWSVARSLEDRDVRCLAGDPLQPGVVYAGTHGTGVLRSVDAGQTWQPAGLDGQAVRALTVSRIESGTLYAGTKPALVFVSRDSGAR